MYQKNLFINDYYIQKNFRKNLQGQEEYGVFCHATVQKTRILQNKQGAQVNSNVVYQDPKTFSKIWIRKNHSGSRQLRIRNKFEIKLL
jgi:hypothetical protein